MRKRRSIYCGRSEHISCDKTMDIENSCSSAGVYICLVVGQSCNERVFLSRLGPDVSKLQEVLLWPGVGF